MIQYSPCHETPAAARRVPLVVLLVLVLFGCQRESPGTGEPFERADMSAFGGHSGVRTGEWAFDVVAADMDVDGDPDLLINWHHLGPMELFENKGGRFELVNRQDQDGSGLFDHPGIPSFFGAAPEMLSRIEGSTRSGLYLWHDVNRKESWRFVWKDEDRRYPGFLLDLVTSLEFLEVEGLAASEVEKPSRRELRITVPTAAERRVFSVKARQTTVRLYLRLRAPSGEGIPIFVGRDLTPFPHGEIDLWKPDPHGIAWVDVEAGPRPEIYITRGGLMGELALPLEPKLDDFFRPGSPGGLVYERASESTVPRDNGRGRRVEWVDVDNDGYLELSVANKATPDKLLIRGKGSGPFRDGAAERGLDLQESDVQCWGDYDGDGFQDLYFLEGRTIHIMKNLGGLEFERLPGDRIGLTLDPSEKPSRGLFEFAAIHLADFDNDGQLDVWLLGYGKGRTNHLFRRDGGHYTNITEGVGLASIRGNKSVVLLDLDNDGFEDAVSTAGWRRAKNKAAVDEIQTHALLWQNREGKAFDFRPLPLALVPEPIHAATSLDADGDGREDLVLIGADRHLLLNRSDPQNSFVEIALRDRGREPIGALVWIFYSNGSVAVRRYGSAYNSAFSQVLGPLHFGVPSGIQIDKLAVRWPGDRDETFYSAPQLNQTTLIERAR